MPHFHRLSFSPFGAILAQTPREPFPFITPMHLVLLAFEKEEGGTFPVLVVQPSIRASRCFSVSSKLFRKCKTTGFRGCLHILAADESVSRSVNVA